jgi:saccharopine dehydrogenase-like NADP-dependent oxidoreductase
VRIAVIGAGATGRRIVRQLVHGNDTSDLLLVDDAPGAATSVAAAFDGRVEARTDSGVPVDCDIALLAVRGGEHVSLARDAVATGRHVVSVSDSIQDVRGLLKLDGAARSNGVTVVVGSGMMPGLTDVLVAHGVSWLDSVEEIHVAKFGTGGPDCARQHHRALSGICFDWRDGEWVRRAGGSGRELAWFPAPVQAADCYRAALGDPLLLARAHPGVGRVTARMAATRRDRLTMHLPMLRRPHPEGLLGAVRVDVRGVRDGRAVDVVLGCAERPAVAAGAVAAAVVTDLAVSAPRPGAWGPAEIMPILPFLHELRTRGLRLELFVGSEAQD